MFDFIFMSLLAIPIAFVIRLITTFAAKHREKAWRWIAYVGPTAGFSLAFGGVPLLSEPDVMMGTAVIGLIAFWTLIGSMFGAALATRLLHGEPKAS